MENEGAVKGTSVSADWSECSERERAKQWGLIRSRDCSDIFISLNTLSHWEPWQHPICSVTDCSQGSDTALVEMFKSFIKQLCQSTLCCSVVWHKCMRKVLLRSALITLSKYPLILHASTWECRACAVPNISSLMVGCSLEGCPAACFFSFLTRGFQGILV